MASLAVQLLTVSVLSLQRQLYHNRGLHLTEHTQWWNSSYDFVIVGAGTAGCVLAARLTELPNVSVLLIEAGGPQTVISDIMNAQFGPDTTRVFHSIPQRHSTGAYRDRRIYYPRGRILGGSNSVNDAVYSRGSAQVYDDWTKVYGAPGWTFEEVLPYFLISQNQTDRQMLARNPRYHATRGPLQVSTVPDSDPIFLRWTDAVRAAGWPVIDMNGPSQYGTAIMQTTQARANWTRQSTASAFLEPNIARSNLHVLLHSHATRILFSDVHNQPKATGVQFTRNGHTYQVRTRHELIVSCGAFQSPQLLMLSGVGPLHHLQQLGITQVADLPVGNNLVDHPIVMLDGLTRNHSDVTFGSTLYYSFSAPNLYDLFVNNHGPLTRDPISETYIATGVNGDFDCPDMVLYFQVAVINPNLTAAISVYDQSRLEQWRQYIEPLAGSIYHLNFNFNIFRPVSTGTVRLSSTDPFDEPLIDPNFFSNQRDLLSLIKAMSIGLKIIESPAAQQIVELYAKAVPGCEELFCTDRPTSECYSYLRCVAQTLTGSTGHPVGTCRMGNCSNPDAVVDERLRVRNIAKLRVVDASVMPMVPNSNPNAAVIMIAEKANDFIRLDHGLPLDKY